MILYVIAALLFCLLLTNETGRALVGFLIVSALSLGFLALMIWVMYHTPRHY